MKIAQIFLFQLFLSVIPSFGMVTKVEEFTYPPVMCSDDQKLLKLRSQLNSVSIDNWQECVALDPTITFFKLATSDRPGVCYDYAMKKLLTKYHITQKIITPGCQSWVNTLPGFFKQIPSEKIKKDDLAVYITCTDTVRPKHFGLVFDPATLVTESKWGTVKAVFRHSMFSLPLNWGNGIVFFRLKKEYRISGILQNTFIGHMKSVLYYPLEMRQILLNKKLELLMLAGLKGHIAANLRVNIIQLLEQFSCVPLDPRDNRDRTPLMLAVINNNISLVKLFLAYGADSNAKDMYGKTPLMLAQEWDHTEIETVLLRNTHDSKK